MEKAVMRKKLFMLGQGWSENSQRERIRPIPMGTVHIQLTYSPSSEQGPGGHAFSGSEGGRAAGNSHLCHFGGLTASSQIQGTNKQTNNKNIGEES